MTVKELGFDTQHFIEAHTALVLQRNAHSLVIEQGRADTRAAEAVGRIYQPSNPGRTAPEPLR
jgi:hypothetical protein